MKETISKEKRQPSEWEEIIANEATDKELLSKIYNGENTIIKWCWENWSNTCKRMKLEHFLIPYRKINSKWIKYLNVRPETINILEENIGRTLSDINHSKILYDPPPRVMEIKAKINKWD